MLLVKFCNLGLSYGTFGLTTACFTARVPKKITILNSTNGKTL